jgi:hypothetical protein
LLINTLDWFELHCAEWIITRTIDNTIMNSCTTTATAEPLSNDDRIVREVGEPLRLSSSCIEMRSAVAILLLATTARRIVGAFDGVQRAN